MIEIIDGNKLIFKFMQNVAGKNEVYITVGGNRPNYDMDWNALMPVVEKIECLKLRHPTLIGGVDYCNLKTLLSHAISGNNVYSAMLKSESDNHVYSKGSSYTKIGATWQAVVQFIQWYNTETSKTNDSQTIKTTL